MKIRYAFIKSKDKSCQIYQSELLTLEKDFLEYFL